MFCVFDKETRCISCWSISTSLRILDGFNILHYMLYNFISWTFTPNVFWRHEKFLCYLLFASFIPSISYVTLCDCWERCVLFRSQEFWSILLFYFYNWYSEEDSFAFFIFWFSDCEDDGKNDAYICSILSISCLQFLSLCVCWFFRIK